MQTKRSLPDRPKAKKVRPQPKAPGRGRAKAVPEPDELAELLDMLRGAGDGVRAMFDKISEDGDRLIFLRDLEAVSRAPDDGGARARWLRWCAALRQGGRGPGTG